jgi:hypothetical protein
MKYITVLDFEAGKVFQYNTQVSGYIRHKEGERFLTNKGHNLSNCEWMSHEDPQVIKK